MSTSPLRDKLLQLLLEAYPMELRFSELRAQTDNPPKATFTHTLQQLEEQKLAIRNEISYKYVTYTLNLSVYEKMVEEAKKTTNHLYTQLKAKVHE